jgi:hypothetical protein
MTNAIINQTSYLRTSREFPEDMHLLAREMNKSYIEIANSTNSKVDGFFTANKPVINGESWYINNNQKQQALRQVFMLTASGGVFAAVNHGISPVIPGQFIRCFGAYTDGTKTYGFIYGNIGTPIAGQIVFDVTSTQIEFAASSAPVATTGTIVLEWLSQV